MDLFSERFHLLQKSHHFVDNESYDEDTCGSKRLYKLKLILDHLNVKFRSEYIAQCEVSVDVSLRMWRDVHRGRYTLLQDVLDLV